MKKSLLYVLGILAAIYMVVSAAAISFVASSSPLVYSIQPFSIDKFNYETGDPMIITSYRCNYENGPLVVSTVERYFFNSQTGEKFTVAPSPGVVQVGCSWQDAKVYDGFPAEMPTGYYFKRGVTQATGRWRTVNVAWQTEQFHYTKTR